MPRLIDKIKYTEAQDGRRKILTSQHEEVRDKYRAFNSLRATAKYYGVDKRTIQFIVYPERLEALKEHNRKIKHWLKYYDTEKNRIAMKKLRDKKLLIFGNKTNL